MGTQFRIVLYAPSGKDASSAATAAFERIGQLDGLLSDYKDDSELTRLCRGPAGKPTPVSPDLFAVLADSADLARRSDGAFDVTCGPLVRLWRRARRQRELPKPERIERARVRVGPELMRLDPDYQTVELAVPDMQLDLGGIAKGFACDAALAVLAQRGVNSALVDGGGGISVSGPPPGKTAWTIAIAPPSGGSIDAEASSGNDLPLLLTHAAVATSGDASQYLELEGRRYSHIIDPRSGQALTDPRQVTVVAPRGALADGLATALCVLDPPAGLALADQSPNVAARIVAGVGSERRVLESSRWSELPRPNSDSD